jgi:hypothetical protein
MHTRTRTYDPHDAQHHTVTSMQSTGMMGGDGGGGGGMGGMGGGGMGGMSF